MELLTEKEREYYDSLKSKGYLALGAEIHLLTRQLQIAKEGLVGIRDHEWATDTWCNTSFGMGVREGHKTCSSLAAAALKKMGEVKP